MITAKHMADTIIAPIINESLLFETLLGRLVTRATILQRSMVLFERSFVYGFTGTCGESFFKWGYILRRQGRRRFGRRRGLLTVLIVLLQHVGSF